MRKRERRRNARHGGGEIPERRDTEAEEIGGTRDTESGCRDRKRQRFTTATGPITRLVIGWRGVKLRIVFSLSFRRVKAEKGSGIEGFTLGVLQLLLGYKRRTNEKSCRHFRRKSSLRYNLARNCRMAYGWGVNDH